MKTAIVMVINIPELVLDTLVYHSGRKSRTATMERTIGNENMKAMGKPRTILLTGVDSASRDFSQ